MENGRPRPFSLANAYLANTYVAKGLCDILTFMNHPWLQISQKSPHLQINGDDLVSHPGGSFTVY